MVQEEIKKLYNILQEAVTIGYKFADIAEHFIQYWHERSRDEQVENSNLMWQLKDYISDFPALTDFEYCSDDDDLDISKMLDYYHDIYDRSICIKVLVSDLVRSLNDPSIPHDNYVQECAILSGLSSMQPAIFYSSKMLSNLLQSLLDALPEEKQETFNSNGMTSVMLLTQRCYKECLTIMETALFKNNPHFELIPLIYVLADLGATVSGKEREVITDQVMETFVRIQPDLLCSDDAETQIFNRCMMYGKIISGEEAAWGEWMVQAPKPSILAAIVAFGDIMYNPERGKDYEHALPITNNVDVLKCMQFSKETMSPLIATLTNYFNDIQSCSN